jgi:hypothetical protein
MSLDKDIQLINCNELKIGNLYVVYYSDTILDDFKIFCSAALYLGYVDHCHHFYTEDNGNLGIVRLAGKKTIKKFYINHLDMNDFMFREMSLKLYD